MEHASFVSDQVPTLLHGTGAGEEGLGDGETSAMALRAQAHFENLTLSIGNTELVAVTQLSASASRGAAALLQGQLRKTKGKSRSPC